MILPKPPMSQLRDYIDKHPESAKRLVGLDYSQLIELISHGERLHNQPKKESEQKKIRIIKAGGGRPPKLRDDEPIILTLVYLHNWPTFQMLGLQFGVRESAANYIFHKGVKILRELLPASLVEQLKKMSLIGHGYQKYCRRLS